MANLYDRSDQKVLLFKKLKRLYYFISTPADVYITAQTKLYASSGKLVEVQSTILRELEKPISEIPMDR